MLNIEIAKNEKMSMGGAGILRALQDKEFSTIDLIARECIQNSLDAYRKVNIPQDVKVNFQTGTFRSSELTDKLEDLGELIEDKYHNGLYDYIAIEDSNTTGLDGEINVKDVTKKHGNFQKLVYEIAKPQEDEGAGGAWGYGKTVYYRMGIGLVAFYTKYLDRQGNPKERLAMTYVEDETDYNSFLRKITKDNRGIAWFGIRDDDGSNETKPETDSKAIKDFLGVFDIKPFRTEQTGTKIIIPYIDKEEILINMDRMRKDFDQDESYYYYWKDDFEEALKMAVLRWYAPRLNNIDYTRCFNLPSLSVSINNEEVDLEDEGNVLFSLVNKFYSIAACNNKSIECYEHIDNSLCEDLNVKEISYSRKNTVNGILGTVVYGKIHKSIFRSGYNPYVYLGENNDLDKGNRPIVCFCRKPGMIINYELGDKWADKILSTEKDEYLLAVFVLNSGAKSCVDGITLEEYIRHKEEATHSSWNDWDHGDQNKKAYGKIVAKIQNEVKKLINDTYKDETEKKPTRVIGISEKIGRLFMPTSGFGTRAEHKKTPPVVEGGIRTVGTTKSFSTPYDFTEDTCKIDFSITLRNKFLSIEPTVMTESGQKDRKYWIETIGKELPFEIQSVFLKEVKKVKTRSNLVLNRCDISEFLHEDIEFSTSHKSKYGFNKFVIRKNVEEGYIVKGTMVIYTSSKDYSFALKVSKGDD